VFVICAQLGPWPNGLRQKKIEYMMWEKSWSKFSLLTPWKTKSKNSPLHDRKKILVETRHWWAKQNVPGNQVKKLLGKRQGKKPNLAFSCPLPGKPRKRYFFQCDE